MGILNNTCLWRYFFAASALFAVIMASMPQPPIPGNPPDTLLHILAFTVLTVLARLAFPRARAWMILTGLSMLGGTIEFIQAIPALNREASFTDWLVDMLAILTVLGVMAFPPGWSDETTKKVRARRPGHSDGRSSETRLLLRDACWSRPACGCTKSKAD